MDSIRDRFSWDYYQYAKELEKIALSKKISVQEPYAGKKIGEFCILSPSQSWHLFDLIPNSDKTKEFKPTKENPKSDGKTSRENESSVILYGNLGYGGILFTGDAGVEALEGAYEYAKNQGINIAKKKFIQVPHHGSRRNVSSQVLDHLIGEIETNKEKSISAFVSAGKNDSSHPRQDDAKLFWKNIAYGFFRNSILLSLATLSLSCSSEYFYLNISIILITIAMTKICSENYAQQALESYKERRITLFS